MFGIGKKPVAGDEATLTQPIPAGWQIVDLGLLGKGGMSRVYRVRDETLGREVAFKVLRPELASESQALERFVEEARITAQLDHPNIPPVYALAAEKKKTTCFTMKVLSGQTLQQLLVDGQVAPNETLFRALEVLVRVCDAVAYAHSKGILHCDLKPTNVMVGDFGQIYVVDWGLAVRKADLPSEKDDHGAAIGTPAYMAPEQARGKNHALDERTDIFQLGGILYRMLAGRPPYVANTAEATVKLAEKAAWTSPTLFARAGQLMPGRLVTMAKRALEPNPADRYQTVAEFKSDLEDFIKGTARLPEKRYQAGEVIIQEGDVGDCAYVILDGHCQANRMVAGKKQLLRLMGPGEMFGEAAVLTGTPRTATVTALIDTTLAVVDATYLTEEMERTSLIALAIRAVASSFLDLHAQTATLIKEQTLARAVELVLTELVFHSRVEADGSHSVAWKALLDKVVQKTGLAGDLITQRVARQPGVKIDVAGDRLRLSQ